MRGAVLSRGHYEKASPALKEAFADISKRIKKHLIRYKQSMWIGPEALRLYESGQVTINAVGILQDLAKHGALPPATGKPTSKPTGKIDRRTVRAAKVGS